jgi:hypothetical protein
VRQLTTRHCHHGFIQQCQTVWDPALLQANPPLLMAGSGDEIRLAALVSDPGGLSGGGVCGLEVARVEPLLDEGQQQVPALGAGARFAFEHALGTAEPADSSPGLAAKQQAESQPEGATGRAQAPAGLKMESAGAFEGAKVVVVAAGEIGRGR